MSQYDKQSKHYAVSPYHLCLCVGPCKLNHYLVMHILPEQSVPVQPVEQEQVQVSLITVPPFWHSRGHSEEITQIKVNWV